MVIRNVELETVIGPASKVPDNKLPEVAFAGKSNVGKSSLINALMNRKSLARISSKPGKTQTINFYNINSEIYFVDLPGYGYAAVPESEKKRWAKMIDNYLEKSKALQTVFLLVDIRHAPGENDINMLSWIRAKGYSPIVIATKLDKLKRSRVPKAIKTIAETLVIDRRDIIPFSAETKAGREEIYHVLDVYIGGGL